MPENSSSAGSPAPRPPKISVLIPTYNYARYLPEAIESVLEQDFQDYELLIADDCSTDESREVIRRYAGKDGRIRCEFHPANVGMVRNWNHCLNAARGEYVQFLFADDKLAGRQTLGRMARLLDDNAEAVMGVAARNIIDENSKITEVAAHLGRSGGHDGLEVITRCLETNMNLVGEPSVVMFRRQFAGRGFSGQYRQIPDLEMWFHLLEKGDAVYTREPLYSFRKHPQQQTEVNRANEIGLREHLLLLAEYFEHPHLRERVSPKLLFTQIYWLRKKGDGCAASCELESRLLASLGRGRYRRHYLLHKLGSPFVNLTRFFAKRILGRPMK